MKSLANLKHLKMIKLLINPFRYIAGYKSLTIGLVIIICTSVVSAFSHKHFPDIISVKTSQDYPIWFLLIENTFNWILFSTILYVLAISFSKSSVRFVDIFGTQALARLPYLLVSFVGFSGSLKVFNQHILWTVLKRGEPVDLSILDTTVAILLLVFTLSMTLWVVLLMYNAFKVSSNIKGGRLILLFVVSVLGSTIINHYSSSYLTDKFF